MARINFNAADLPESTNDFSPIPAGEYTVTVRDAELRTTKDGSGEYIKLKLHVDGPTHIGRILFSNLNIANKSEVAQRIGQQQLGEIMRAIGLAAVEDTDQLIGGTFLVKVAIREAQNGYEPQNEVKGYKAIQGSAAPTVKKAKPAAGGKPTPPWQRVAESD